MAKLKHFDYLNLKHFVVFITILVFCSCKNDIGLSHIEGKLIPIDSSQVAADTILTFMQPYRERVDQVLDSTLAYAPYKISKDDGTYNTTAGNLMADLMFSEANPIFKKRTGKEIDFVLMNHGGMRSIISKGNISARTAYEVMPFENNIWVVELKGTSVTKMINYLIASGRPHPIGGMQIVLNTDDSVHSIAVQRNPFDENRSYYIATSDYLVKGGDSMVFFKEAVSVTDIDYKIRNAIIDYFKKVDTIAPVIDDRFYKLK